MTGRENADQCCRESHQRERKTFPAGGEQQSSLRRADIGTTGVESETQRDKAAEQQPQRQGPVGRANGAQAQTLEPQCVCHRISPAVSGALRNRPTYSSVAPVASKNASSSDAVRVASSCSTRPTSAASSPTRAASTPLRVAEPSGACVTWTVGTASSTL